MTIFAFVTALLSSCCLLTAVGQEVRRTCEMFKYSIIGPVSNDNPMGQMGQSFSVFIDDVCSKNPGIPTLRVVLENVRFHMREYSDWPQDPSVRLRLWQEHPYLEMLGVTIDTQKVPHVMDSTVFVGELLYPSDYSGPTRAIVSIPHLELKSGNYERLIQTHFILVLYLLAMDIRRADGDNPTELARDQALITALLSAAHERIPVAKEGAGDSLLEVYRLVDKALQGQQTKPPEPR